MVTIGLNARKGTHKVRGGGAVVDGRLDDPMELLESEGLPFTLGRVDPSRRWQP
jgi:hypothetical protein